MLDLTVNANLLFAKENKVWHILSATDHSHSLFTPLVPIIPSSPTVDEEDVPSKLVEGEDGEEEQEIQLEPTQEEMEKERLTNRAEQV